VARVGVQFEIDANGILHVLARDTKTGVEKIVEIRSAVDVSDEAVEAMISDSLEHAFEDVSERVWTETKLKADEMLRAVDAAFAQVGDGIDPAEKEKIERAAADVRDALAQQDVRKLQGANNVLDDATQSLAAALVEKAMRAGS
jgi:molecular chaperone DnaK